MNNQPDKTPGDPLDALLRKVDEYVPDNGFTTKVIQSLPVSRRRSGRFILLFVVLIGCAALAVWQYPTLLAVVEARRTLISWQTAGVLLAMLSVLATLTWTALVLANDEG